MLRSSVFRKPAALALSASLLVLGGCQNLSGSGGQLATESESAEATALPANAEIRPYLQNATPDGITLLWRSAKKGVGEVSITAPDGSTQHFSEPGATQDHRIRITGLHGGAAYRYAVTMDGRPIWTSTFRTARPRGQNGFTFGVMGDMGKGSPEQFAIANQLARYSPEFTLLTGDIVYFRGAEGDYLPKYFKPYQDLIDDQVFFPTLGNHDILTWLGKPYFRFFELPTGNVEAAGRYYQFSYGDVDFFGLDSNQAFTKILPQYRWVKAALAESSAKWKIVFFHHPPYSAGKHGDDKGVKEHLVPLFETYGVDVVFAGHEHNYERIKPMREAADGGRPITYIVTGGGGTDLRPVGKNERTAYSESIHHFMGVKVEDRQISIQAIDQGGRVFDATVVSK